MAISKLELKQAIENGESVWYLKGRIIKQIDLKHTHPIFNGYQIDIMIEDENGWHTEFYGIKDLYKTKAEAEHYLHHANITRTEQLPFYTFSEIAKDEKNFKMGKTYTLIEDKNFVLDINKSYVSQIVLYTGKEKYSWNFNEENFYKAYDECVRLFRGGE